MSLFNNFLKLSLALIFLIPIWVLGQNSKPSKVEKSLYKQAYANLDMERYGDAIKDYKELLLINPKNSQYNFAIGIAYLRSPKEFPLAEKYLKNALQYSTKDTIEKLYFYLAKAYQNNHKFKEAKDAYKNFERFIKPSKAGLELMAQVQWLQKTCNHGEYHVKLNTKNPLENKSKPIDNTKKYFLNATDYVILHNLGTQINTVHDDEGAVFFNSENDIFFTSKRNPFANPNELTYDKKFEQVYVSKLEQGDWKTPSILSSLKLFTSDFLDPASYISIVAVNKNEDKLIFYKNEILYETQKKDDKWSEPKAFPKNINISGSIQSSACLSDDGNLLIVVSTKEGGYGKRDMYLSKRDADGNWSDLENMGSVLNTEQDEDTPFLVGDDLLYFSSKGHSSIGGYDVFYSKLSNGEWTNPQSLGIPINTPQDEISYVRSKKDPQTAFYASARVDGYGYKDIYKINSYYQTKKRDDLPSIAMTDFLSDELKYNEKQKEQEALAAATPEVVAAPIPTPDPEIKKEEEITTEPIITKKDPVVIDEDIFRDILFAFNGNQLTPESEEQVKKIAKFMTDNPDFVVSLSGHTDYLGSEDVNENISEQRAILVVNKLKAAGADPYNIQYAYYGESKPKADGSDNSENRAKNRRVEFDLEQLAIYRVVTFGTNSYSIDSKGDEKLKQIADYVNANSSSKVNLSGYSDSVGNADYNKKLSEKRVSVASKKLISLGVNESQITTEFFGEEKTSAPGTNSRRVEIRVK